MLPANITQNLRVSAATAKARIALILPALMIGVVSGRGKSEILVP